MLSTMDIAHKDELFNVLGKRGFYNPDNVFHHYPTFEKPDKDSKYQVLIEIVKWNTRSAKVIKLGATWDEKKQSWTVSYYKTGSSARISNYA